MGLGGLGCRVWGLTLGCRFDERFIVSVFTRRDHTPAIFLPDQRHGGWDLRPRGVFRVHGLECKAIRNSKL